MATWPGWGGLGGLVKYRNGIFYGLCHPSRQIGCQCASWWVYSPILEWQILEQLSHGQAPRLLVGWASPCGLHVYAGEPRLLHLRTARLLPGIVTSSSSGLVSRWWDWMAASRTFSCSWDGIPTNSHTSQYLLTHWDHITAKHDIVARHQTERLQVQLISTADGKVTVV